MGSKAYIVRWICGGSVRRKGVRDRDELNGIMEAWMGLRVEWGKIKIGMNKTEVAGAAFACYDTI